MQFCFIIEEQYRNDTMPAAVLDQLKQWGHRVDIIEPATTIIDLADLLNQQYDACILKTVSDGPGLSLLEAAEAVGIPTINHARAIRRVRDKAVAAAAARAQGIPVPTTYFLSSLHLLAQVPVEQYPLVVKPTNGSSCRDIHLVSNLSELAHLNINPCEHRFWLAQHYEENVGFDTKVYVAGTEVFAVAKRSPLHPDVVVEKQLVPVTPALRSLALRIGALFDLDIYGLDVVETAHGLVVVDINDFPSFSFVPEAPTRVALCILEIAQHLREQRQQHVDESIRHDDKLAHILLAQQWPWDADKATPICAVITGNSCS